MRAIEMQIRYWEKERKDAERRMELYEEGSRLWEISQKRAAFARLMIARIEVRKFDDVCGT